MQRANPDDDGQYERGVISAQGGSVGIRRPLTDRRPPLCENPLQYSHPCDKASADDDTVDYDSDSQETKVMLELYNIGLI